MFIIGSHIFICIVIIIYIAAHNIICNNKYSYYIYLYFSIYVHISIIYIHVLIVHKYNIYIHVYVNMLLFIYPFSIYIFYGSYICYFTITQLTVYIEINVYCIYILY